MDSNDANTCVSPHTCATLHPLTSNEPGLLCCLQLDYQIKKQLISRKLYRKEQMKEASIAILTILFMRMYSDDTQALHRLRLAREFLHSSTTKPALDQCADKIHSAHSRLVDSNVVQSRGYILVSLQAQSRLLASFSAMRCQSCS